MDSEDKKTWYSGGLSYWTNTESTVDGVMGGYGDLTEVDLKISRVFLEESAKKFGMTFGRVLDCGAGIGRISKGLLLPLFEEVHLVEPCSKFLKEAERSLASPKATGFYCKGLQEFEFEKSYHCIWI